MAALVARIWWLRVTTIAHISDLHFPCVSERACENLRHRLNEVRPGVVVVSGDLTQRGRERQYASAFAYLGQLPHPRIVIPGNHDVPLFDLRRRFFHPAERFLRLICDDPMPVHRDDELLIVGVNSTRAWTLDWRGFWKNGTLSPRQLDDLRARFASATPAQLRVLAMHHPLVNPWDDSSRDTARHRTRILHALRDCGVDVVLSGHLHKAYARNAPASGRPILCIQCGTTTSTRLRDEANAFNLLTWDSGRLTLQVMRFDGHRFEPEVPQQFQLR